MNFEEILNENNLNVDIHPTLQFESYIKKHKEEYSFLSLTDDLQNISKHYSLSLPRFIVKSERINIVSKFLGITYQKYVGYIHIICAEIKYIDAQKILHLNVYGQKEFDILKKTSIGFIAKNSDISVDLKLISPNDGEYKYDQFERIGFFQIIKSKILTHLQIK